MTFDLACELRESCTKTVESLFERRIHSPILEEGFRRYNITLQHIGVEQKEGKQRIEKSVLLSITRNRLIGSRYPTSI